MITERAVEYIRKTRKREEPFFLYVPYNAPHYPMHAPQKYLDRFPELPWDRQIMAAMISAVDDSIGEIIGELERQEILENTCVFFQSDNGPSRETRNWLDGKGDHYYGGTAGILKGHKGSLYEGGIRVPSILSWPAKIPANQVIDEMTAGMDIFPTFLKAAGGDIDDYELDGKDILPVVTDDETTPHQEIFWELGDQTAVRRDKWKLVLNGRLVEGSESRDDIHLSNLEEDMSERNNLKDGYPEICEDLKTTALSWRAKIDERWEKQWEPKVKEKVLDD